MSMLIAFLVFTILELHAQGVTTAQLFGQISDSKGSPLIAASIHAVHMPSGTSYGVYSRDDGRFNIPNMRVGGPYSIKITYVGFGEKNFENIFLELGENKKLNIALEESTTALAAVEIIAKVGTIGEISGTGTQISACLLYTSDAADERSSVDLGGRRIIKKKNKKKKQKEQKKKKKIKKTYTT